MPRHGTPMLMANDQLHHLLHRWIREDLAEQVGLGSDLGSRPRGPDVVMIARAFFRAIGKLTREQALWVFFHAMPSRTTSPEGNQLHA